MKSHIVVVNNLSELQITTSGMDIYDVYCRLKQNPSTVYIPVIFVTAMVETGVIPEDFRSREVDYIERKPFKEDDLLGLVQIHLKVGRLMRGLRRKSRQLQQEMERQEQAEDTRRDRYGRLFIVSEQEAERWGIDAFIGKSKVIRSIMDEVSQLQSTSRTNVLIMGESGTGKELIARAIHFGSERARGPFIPVNCSAIPRELAESALFGHVRGAFTGASESRKGYFELAHGGTLFLDEIGDMPLELQPKLLRVIEDGYVLPLGGTVPGHADVRIIASTNQNLLRKVAAGTFREELYFRLERFTLIVPPLRERKEDIPLLIEHFLKMLSSEMGVPKLTLSPEALEALESYYFPGNVRELKNIVECALLRSRGEPVIIPEHLQLIDPSVLRALHADLAVTPWEDQSLSDLEKIEELLIRRSRKPTGAQDEEKILAYAREHGGISNAKCCELLSIERRRASYLLQKLCRYGLLVRQGDRRWARYFPA
jgi:transcriptional regulator with GAF, ATPase, and Fis domain